MTNQADLEQLLRGMTAEEAVANSVSTFKTPLKSFDGRPYRFEGKADGFEGRQQLHIYIKDLANVQADSPYVDQMGQPRSEFDWAMNMPNKVTDNSPMGILLLSTAKLDGQLNNIPDLCKQAPLLHFERVIKENPGNGRDGRPLSPTVGYQATAILSTGGGSNGASAPALDLTGASTAVALGYLDGTDGGAEFTNAALADEIVKADKMLVQAIFKGKATGGFVSVMTAMGRVALDAESGKYSLVTG